MHGYRFLREMAISHCSYRSIRIIHNLPPFTSMVRSPAEMWSELLSLGQLIEDEPLGKRCRIYQCHFNQENLASIAP